MIRMSVSYPRAGGTKFDGEYWIGTHMPMLPTRWPQLVKWEADVGLDDQPNFAVAHLFFDSQDDLGAAMAASATGEVMADIANYTDTQPVIQVSEIAAASS